MLSMTVTNVSMLDTSVTSLSTVMSKNNAFNAFADKYDNAKYFANDSKYMGGS